MDIQYEGTNYVGWQRQPSGKSIQGLLESALTKIAKEKVTLFSASRTDAGVHAFHQVASFSLKDSKAPMRAFMEGANSLIPESIRVREAKEVDLWFHANGDAKEKTYRYFFQFGPHSSVFLRRYSWHWKTPLDINLMSHAAQSLLGAHDFSAFRTRAETTKTSIRTVKALTFQEGPCGLYYFEMTADGFLKHMVRNIVGTLAEVGLGKRTSDEITDILDSKKRQKAGQSAPPHGLFLWRVLY